MTAFDLPMYLRRINAHGPTRADYETLAELHRAHVEAIPFENLDIQMGRRVNLEPDALVAKMVLQRRGGYCFEQNAVFAMALRTAGFEVATCEARVRQQAGGVVRPRTHMVLRVAAGGRVWLADVGFGADGLVEPVALDGASSEQLGTKYRIAAEGPIQVLQRQTASEWEDLYAVLPDPVYPVDFEAANWFTSTYPRSPFVLNLTVQRICGGSRRVLRNLTYAVTRGLQAQTREVSRAELVPLLRETFALDLPEDATFLALDQGA